jgi:hypothetical protein
MRLKPLVLCLRALPSRVIVFRDCEDAPGASAHHRGHSKLLRCISPQPFVFVATSIIKTYQLGFGLTTNLGLSGLSPQLSALWRFSPYSPLWPFLGFCPPTHRSPTLPNGNALFNYKIKWNTIPTGVTASSHEVCLVGQSRLGSGPPLTYRGLRPTHDHPHSDRMLPIVSLYQLVEPITLRPGITRSNYLNASVHLSYALGSIHF